MKNEPAVKSEPGADDKKPSITANVNGAAKEPSEDGKETNATPAKTDEVRCAK